MDDIFTIIERDFHLAAIGNNKQIVVVRINESDATLSIFYMVVKPIFLITVAVQIVLAFIWVEPHKIAVLPRV